MRPFGSGLVDIYPVRSSFFCYHIFDRRPPFALFRQKVQLRLPDSNADNTHQDVFVLNLIKGISGILPGFPNPTNIFRMASI